MRHEIDPEPIGRSPLRRVGPDLLPWSLAYRVEAGTALDLSLFPFQRELHQAFGDASLETVDVMKSAQCGVSAAGISLALYAADVWGATVLYVLPTDRVASNFSDARISPAIEASAYLAGRVVGTDNKGLKRFGDAFIYLTGSNSETQALSVPADLLIFDEYDWLDHRHVPKFRKRLNSPRSMKLERRFSNPSYPEDGIHAEWLRSDQRSWLITCPACRLEAPIAWDVTEGHLVDEDRALRVCGRCERPLSPEAIASGRWVPARPEQGARGYHISRLIVPDERIPALVANHRARDEASLQTHHNFDLGLPYAPRSGSLSREQVRRCRREYHCPSSYAGSSVVTAGVDVGAVLHVRISWTLGSGKAGPLFLGTVPDFEDLAHLMRAYSVSHCLIDERPEERKAREFMGSHPGRVMLLRWSGEEQRDPIVIDSERRLVIARRTVAADRLVAEFTEEKRLLPKYLPEDYLAQVTAPHRVTEETPRGQKIARYVSTRQDDYFFAECHDMLAREARPIPPAGASVEPEPIRGILFHGGPRWP